MKSLVPTVRVCPEISDARMLIAALEADQLSKGELAASERRADRRAAWLVLVLAVGMFGWFLNWFDYGRTRYSGSTQYVKCVGEG